MKGFIKITDCSNVEHNINVDFIYSITNILPRTEKDKLISVIHLSHKGENKVFSDIRTYEVSSNLLKRLEVYK